MAPVSVHILRRLRNLLRRSSAVGVVALLVFAAVSPAGAGAGPTPPASPDRVSLLPAVSAGGGGVSSEYSRDHVLVKLEAGADAAVLARHRAAGGPVERLTLSPDGVRGAAVGRGDSLARWVKVPVGEGRTPPQVVSELRGAAGVAAVELDLVVRLDPQPAALLADAVFEAVSHTEVVSVDDPGFARQWHLNTLDLASVWGDTTGDGVVVAVLDSGVSRGSDLECRSFVHSYNAVIDTEGDAGVSDASGHGTHVAGTVAQCTNNGVGVAGVAHGAALMPVKVLDDTGTGLLSDVAEGIDWARAHGADVINLSLGCAGCDHPTLYDAVKAADADGVVLVAAAGNAGVSQVTYPAAYAEVLAVGASDYRNELAPYSNYGPGLDLVAPGGDLGRDDNGDGRPDGVLQEKFGAFGWGYYWMSGTSMASPHVAGAVALLLETYPDLQPSEVRDILTASATDLGPAGRDETFGYGLVNIHEALVSLDQEPPVWGSSAVLLVDAVGETWADLSWTPASDNVGVSSYEVAVAQDIQTLSGLTSTIEGLEAGTSYVVEVRARDQAGNWSVPLETTLTTAQAVEEPMEEPVEETEPDPDSPTSEEPSDPEEPADSEEEPSSPEEPADSEEDATPKLEFEDTKGHLFEAAVDKIAAAGITRGCNPPENTRFCPDDYVTRGQMAAFLSRALNLSATSDHVFLDTVGHTFEGAAARLAAAGITRGCNPPENDRFCPDEQVTRGQMAAFLTRALGLSPGEYDFTDTLGHTFEEAAERLAAAGITRGCNPPENDRFCPDDYVTRGQMAAFLVRAGLTES